MLAVRLLLLFGVLLLAYAAVFHLAPAIVVRIGRALGFRMELTPLTARRVRRFRRIHRGYISLVLIGSAFAASLVLELTVNHKPLYVRYGELVRYPALADWLNTFAPWRERNAEVRWPEVGLAERGGGEIDGRLYARWVADPATLETEAQAVEAAITQDEKRFRAVLAASARERGLTYDPASPLPEAKQQEYAEQRRLAAAYRRLRRELEAGKAAIVMPPYPFSPGELLLNYEGSPPYPPVWARPANAAGMWPLLGTDFDGRDVLSQLLYGFRVSFAFALAVALIGYAIGVSVGGIMGYFGGWIDIAVQRVIEVWSSIPFLFTIMILASVINPGFLALAVLLIVLRSWLGITYTVRGEFYRERSRDYVQAARAIGLRDTKIMRRHILPNALVPVVTFLPFDIVAYIGALVSLDYLGFGLPPSTPSWGRLLRQGADNVKNYPELVIIPVIAFAVTLFCVVMIGEAVREAFDPKEYARLR
ncbi:MAG: ABC transporter permease subunit [Planctomycetota bacterium]|nr:MAG: ABC transporter permease subunit [Planctomycetota bacterium]